LRRKYMYEFIDSIDNKSETFLPAEAVSFDDSVLDQTVKGFRTLYVTGRQSIPIELSEVNLSAIDGSRFRKKRYKPRSIVVGYQIKADTAEELVKTYDQLLFYLSGNQKKVQFADDRSRHYIGTVSELADPPAGRLFFNSEFTIYCADPFKYSDDDFTADGTNGSVSFLYKGTYKAYPEFIFTLNSVTSEIVLYNGTSQIKVAAKTDNFASGTVIRLRVSDAYIAINDVKSISYGDVENDWDAFVLNPGMNTFSYSAGDGEAVPDLSVKYKAVFL